MSEEVCPCCGRHCPLTNPSCERGAEYAKSGYKNTDSKLGAYNENVRHGHKKHHGHHGDHAHHR